LQTIKEVDLPGEIEGMFRKSIPEYRELQLGQQDLVKLLEQTEYVYFVSARIGDEEVGKVLCGLEK
jgi:hypothetical protein